MKSRMATKQWGGKRAGAGTLRVRFTLDKTRAKTLRDLARLYGVDEQQILNLAIDKTVPELFQEAGH